MVALLVHKQQIIGTLCQEMTPSVAVQVGQGGRALVLVDLIMMLEVIVETGNIG
jgi:hypothetical protein